MVIRQEKTGGLRLNASAFPGMIVLDKSLHILVPCGLPCGIPR